MTFDFHPEAETEFLDAIEYYENCAPGLGEDFSLEVYFTVQNIRKIGDGSIFKEMSKKAPPMTSPLPRLHGSTDNQGARFNHASILARLTWEAVEQE